MNAPTLWLLAGGNGAGKSTFYREILEPLGLPFVNADLIARELDRDAPESASYAAAAIAERLRSEMLATGGSFCFETVFSHPSKIDFVAEAKSRGYRVHLVYIDLGDAQLNAARVAQRVQQGGHSVPTDKILSRLPRTRANIRKTVPLCDSVWLLENSALSQPFREVARVDAGALVYAEEPLPAWAQQILGGH